MEFPESDSSDDENNYILTNKYYMRRDPKGKLNFIKVESRGDCLYCKKQVWTNQSRIKYFIFSDKPSIYFHTECMNIFRQKGYLGKCGICHHPVMNTHDFVSQRDNWYHKKYT